jgi:hypothetical protein
MYATVKGVFMRKLVLLVMLLLHGFLHANDLAGEFGRSWYSANSDNTELLVWSFLPIEGEMGAYIAQHRSEDSIIIMEGEYCLTEDGRLLIHLMESTHITQFGTVRGEVSEVSLLAFTYIKKSTMEYFEVNGVRFFSEKDMRNIVNMY